jgi:hypothetical protein
VTYSTRNAFTGTFEDLASTLVALLRTDGHLCNVLTHISRDDWHAIEVAIAAILRPRAAPNQLSNVAQNMLELICDDRGVTGRLMRPFFFEAVGRIAGKPEMERLKKRVERLRRRMSGGARLRLAHSRRRKDSANLLSARQIRIDRAAPARDPAIFAGARP